LATTEGRGDVDGGLSVLAAGGGGDVGGDAVGAGGGAGLRYVAGSRRPPAGSGPSPAGAGIPGHSGFSTSPTTPTGDEKAPPAAKRANEATGALGVALAKAKASGHAQPIADKTTAGQRSAPAAPERDLPAGRPALDGTVASSTTPKGATSTYSYTDHRLTSILGCGNPVEISGC
jgi:hypothetical protein